MDTDQAIRTHVDDDDKKTYPVETTGQVKQTVKEVKTYPTKTMGQVRHQIFINESGLYSLIFGSKLETTKKFKMWVTSEILPSIRKYGHYMMFNNPKTLAFKIEDEYDLHTKVVNFIRIFYPKAIIIVGLGENQDTLTKRITSYKKGYMKGEPDLIIQNLHKHYSGLVLEFKTPQGNGIASDEQKDLLEQYKENGYKCIISNDYDLILKTINDHMCDIRIKCKYCKRKFVSHNTLMSHNKYFHRIL